MSNYYRFAKLIKKELELLPHWLRKRLTEKDKDKLSLLAAQRLGHTALITRLGVPSQAALVASIKATELWEEERKRCNQFMVELS